MVEEMIKIFNRMTASEVESFLKSDAKEYLKERKDSEKAELVATVKSGIKEGDFVIARYKDSEISGKVVALREKSFSILTEDILNAKGEASRVSRGYDFVIEVGDSVSTENIAEAV